MKIKFLLFSQEETEAVVTLDWENGYVECSAKEPKIYIKTINNVLKEL